MNYYIVNLLCVLAPSSHDIDYDQQIKRLTSMGFSKVRMMFVLYFFKCRYIIKEMFSFVSGRRCGLVVSAFIAGLIDSGSSPGLGHCVACLGKTVYSPSASGCRQMVPASLMLDNQQIKCGG